MFVDYSSSDDDTPKPNPQQNQQQMTKASSTAIVEEKKSVTIQPKMRVTSKLPSAGDLLGGSNDSNSAGNGGTRRRGNRLNVEDDTSRSKFQNANSKNITDEGRESKRRLPSEYENDDECPVMDKYYKIDKPDSEVKANQEAKKQEELKKQIQQLAPMQTKTKRKNIATLD